MRKNALLFALVVALIVIVWTLLFGGCTHTPDEAAKDGGNGPAPALSLEELDRAYLRDQGVFAPPFGDGEMGAPSTDAPDAFGLGRELPEHVDIDDLFAALPRDSDNFDIVFLYYVEIEIVEIAPRAQQPYVDLWYCEPEEANEGPAVEPYMDRWTVEPDGHGDLRAVPALPTLPGTY